jgi:hypothetical protein
VLPARWEDLPAPPGLLSVDASYEELVASLPTGLRGPARRLPHRLGVAHSPEGGWQEFVCLHPNRDLPLYAAEAAGTITLPAAALLRYTRAHHVGGFTWLLRDRLADGQVVPDAVLLALSRELGNRWRHSLEDACGDAPLVRRVVGAVTHRWRRGTGRERALLREGGMSPALYAEVVRDKLRWISAASMCLVSCSAAGAAEQRARAFLRAHDLFLLGLQAVDDVNDAAEDRALHGHDVAGALGCTAGALLRVAPKLVARASAEAAGAGFTRLALWLGTFARAISPLHREGDQLADELDAIAIAGEMEQGAEDDAASVEDAHAS